MYYAYVLKNTKGQHYIGVTTDIAARLQKHNSNSSRWTKYKGPWELIHKEEHAEKSSALSREHQIKLYKGGRAFKELLRKGARAV